jgi:hypothetical protein
MPPALFFAFAFRRFFHSLMLMLISCHAAAMAIAAPSLSFAFHFHFRCAAILAIFSFLSAAILLIADGFQPPFFIIAATGRHYFRHCHITVFAITLAPLFQIYAIAATLSATLR